MNDKKVIMLADADMAITKKIWKETRRFVVPTYNEVHIFFMALSFVLLVFFNTDLKNEMRGLVNKAVGSGKLIIWIITATVLFIYGFVLSIYHAFSSKRKSETEKIIMLVFALGINGVAGIIAGERILNDYHGALIIFPALNIISSFALLYLIGVADHTMIDDADASPPNLFLGSVITAIAFYFCEFRFELHWSVTFSICVAYAMNFNDMFGRIPIRRAS